MIEVELGIIVASSNEQEVLDKLAPILRQLEDLDHEGECALELHKQ